MVEMFNENIKGKVGKHYFFPLRNCVTKDHYHSMRLVSSVRKFSAPFDNCKRCNFLHV